MSIAPARVLLGLTIAGIWLAVLPAVASADDCATRAARIAAGQVPSNEADPDCKKAAVIGTTVAVAGASAAVAVAAVQLGLRGAQGTAQPTGGQPGRGQGGGAAGPVVTGMYSGPEAIDILVKSGLAMPVKDASGNPVWETDPRTGEPLRYPNGDPVPKVKPAPGFDNLGGSPVSRVVGQSINAGTTELVQTQTIQSVTGFAGHTRPDGTIDPNAAITVDQSAAPRDGFPWKPPVEPPGAAPPTQTGTSQATTSDPPSPPPQPPPAPPKVTATVPSPTPPPQPPPAPPQGAPVPGPVTSTVTDMIKKINMARSAYNSKFTPASGKDALVKGGAELTGLNPDLVKAILGMSRENWAVVSGLIKSGAIGVDSKIGDIISLLPSQKP